MLKDLFFDQDVDDMINNWKDVMKAKIAKFKENHE